MVQSRGERDREHLKGARTLKKTENKGKTETDNSETLNILRLRAEARALLEDPGGPPIIITEYTEPVFDAAGEHIYGGRVCDSRTAEVNGKILVRGEGESLEEFKARACLEVPAMQTGAITMRADG